MTSPLPAFTPIVGGVQLTIRMAVGGQEAVCVEGGNLEPGTALTGAMVTAWLERWWSKARLDMSNEVTLTGATGRDLREFGGAVFEAGLAPSPVGAVAEPLALAGACALVKWNSTGPGRRGKGRTYLPGLSEASVNVGGRSILATRQASIQANMESYRSQQSGVANSPIPAVISRTQGRAYVKTGCSVASIVALQRRRMR